MDINLSRTLGAIARLRLSIDTAETQLKDGQWTKAGESLNIAAVYRNEAAKALAAMFSARARVSRPKARE